LLLLVLFAACAGITKAYSEDISASAEQDYDKSFFDTPENKAIEKMLLDSGDFEVLRTTTQIRSNTIPESGFAAATLFCKKDEQKSIIKVYLFKEGEEWIAYKDLPTHKDHPMLFMELAKQYCQNKLKHFQGIGYVDDSWQNKSPQKRIINYNCMEFVNDQYKDTKLGLIFENDPQQGWQITEEHAIKK